MAEIETKPLPEKTSTVTFPEVRDLLKRIGFATDKRAVQSDDFFSGVSGWRFTAEGDLEANNGTFRGTITATAGNIGGFVINATSLSANNVSIDSANQRISLGSGNDIVILDADDATYRLWVGDVTPASAPFSVNKDGGIFASDGQIANWDISALALSTGAFDTLGTMYFGTSGISLSNVFKVTASGVLTALSGVIGGFTINSTSLYGGIIKTSLNVESGASGVIMDADGLRGFDTILGETFNLPTDGSAPRFSSGVINSTIFEINTNAILRTSEDVGDGTSNSAGILINDTGFYACGPNQLLADANVRILVDGSGFFSGTFEIGGAVKTIDDVADIQDALDDVELAGGGTVYLKSGTYTLTADISVPAGVTLEGVSRDSVIIDCDGTRKLQIIGSNAYSTGTVTISDGDTTVVGSGTTWTSGMVGRFIMLSGLWYEITARASNTSITISPAYSGDNLSGSTYVLADTNFASTIAKLTVANASATGLKLQYTQEAFINDVIIYDCGTGIEVDDTVFPRLVVSSVDCTTNFDATNMWGWKIDFCEFSNASGVGVIMTNCGSATFFDTLIKDCGGAGMQLTNCRDITFLSSAIEGNGGQGVELISGNEDMNFIATSVDGNTSDGIKITATSDRTIISSCAITNNGGYGINIAASTNDNTQVISPAFSNNTSGNINDSGTGTILLPNTPSFIADEDLTAGQPVGLSNYVSGRVARAFRLNSDSTLPFSADGTISFGARNGVIEVGGDKFAFTIGEAATDSLYVVVGEVDPDTKNITVGTPVVVTADITAGRYSLAKLDTDKFIVFYCEDASTTIIKYRVGTISGSTITFGSAATFTTAGSQVFNMRAEYISTDKGVLTYAANNVGHGRVIAFTVSGTTATVGTPVAIPNLMGQSQSVIRLIATDKFAIIAGGYLQIGTISTITITLGTEVQFATTDPSNPSAYDIASHASNALVILWLNGGTFNVRAATISGTTITLGSAVVLTLSGSGSGQLHAESPTSVLVFNAINSSNIIFRKITISGTTITDLGNIIQFVTSGAQVMISLANGYLIAIGVSSTSFFGWIQGMSNNFFGIAESSVARGGSVGVVTSGKIGGQTGLSPGAYYQITSSGLMFSSSTATQNTVDDRYVLAVSDTEVVL